MADGFFGHPFRRFFLRPPVYSGCFGSTAHLDWLESPTAHIFKVNVPGFNRDDMKVQVEDGNTLHVRGEGGEDEVQSKDSFWHVAERWTGNRVFSREIELPDDVKLDQIEARVENGALTVTVPKNTSPKASKVRNIVITSKL
ncbi:heat shock protein [Salix suchowensis]|nr:heat shock protein [Salix suchowensis]